MSQSKRNTRLMAWVRDLRDNDASLGATDDCQVTDESFNMGVNGRVITPFRNMNGETIRRVNYLNDHRWPRRRNLPSPGALTLAIALPYLTRKTQNTCRAISQKIRDAVDAQHTKHVVLSAGVYGGRVVVRGLGGARIPAIDWVQLCRGGEGGQLVKRRILDIMDKNTAVVDIVGDIPTDGTSARAGLLHPLKFSNLTHLRVIPRLGKYIPWFPFRSVITVLFLDDIEVPAQTTAAFAAQCRAWGSYALREGTKLVVVYDGESRLSLLSCWRGVTDDPALLDANIIFQPHSVDHPTDTHVSVRRRRIASWQWDGIAETVLRCPNATIKLIGMDAVDLNHRLAVRSVVRAAEVNYTRWRNNADNTTWHRMQLCSMAQYAKELGDVRALLLETTMAV